MITLEKRWSFAVIISVPSKLRNKSAWPTMHWSVCPVTLCHRSWRSFLPWRLCFHIPFWNQLTNWSYVSWPRNSWPSYSPSFYVHLLVAICFNFVPKFQHLCSSMSPRSVTLGWRSNTFPHGKCLMKGDLRSASKWQLCKTSCPGTTEITSCTNERRVTRAPHPCHVFFSASNALPRKLEGDNQNWSRCEKCW